MLLILYYHIVLGFPVALRKLFNYYFQTYFLVEILCLTVEFNMKSLESWKGYISQYVILVYKALRDTQTS